MYYHIFKAMAQTEVKANEELTLLQLTNLC